MTPGVVEVERQRLRMTRDTDDKTVVVRTRPITDLRSCAKGAIWNSSWKASKVDRRYFVVAEATIVDAECVHPSIFDRFMISMIADVGDRENCVSLAVKGLLNLEAVLLVGWVVELPDCRDNRRRGKVGNAARERVEACAVRKPRLK